jgi:hypothetical protein
MITVYRRTKAGEEGLEPPTDCLEGSCSIQLSYSPVLAQYDSMF